MNDLSGICDKKNVQVPVAYVTRNETSLLSPEGGGRAARLSFVP
jgi:hypothetical protein